MVTTLRTTTADFRFLELIRALDADLWNRYQPYQAKYDGFNKVDETARVVIALMNERAIGCGCFRPVSASGTVEIKRMFVAPQVRGKGIGKQIVQELERWALEEAYSIVRLETGNKQPEAIRLYERMNYKRIANYPPYAGLETSICMEKQLITNSQSASPKPEVWLRGPLPDMPSLLQPVAHALLQAREEVQEIMVDFPVALLWERPAGVASVGFHLQHLAGVLDRLLTYARGEMLTAAQLDALGQEGKPAGGTDKVNELVQAFNRQVDRALDQLRHTDERLLTEIRGVGRAQVPSTVLGLLVHAAEHTQRHVGQLLVTVRVVSAL